MASNLSMAVHTCNVFSVLAMDLLCLLVVYECVSSEPVKKLKVGKTFCWLNLHIAR